MKYSHFYSLVFSVTIAQIAVATPLNDDGVTTFSNGSLNNLTSEPVGFPGQSASYGRDAAYMAGKLTKIGSGRAGFDFTKIANDGSELPESAVLGTAAKDWACTRDNVTGLMWEVKTSDGGVRDSGWRYTWYNSNMAINGGATGYESGGTCKFKERCDTEKYVADVNAVGLCGSNDWRLPNIVEIQGLVDYGQVGMDLVHTMFPNARNLKFWSSNPNPVGGFSDSQRPWSLNFRYGWISKEESIGDAFSVLLVRGGEIQVASTKASGANCNPKIPAVTPSSDFVDNGDGTVLHKTTGLVWKRCAEGRTWDGVKCKGESHGFAWGKAMDSAENSVFAGAADWRLPNIKELTSIVDWSCSDPAINTAIFPDSTINLVWTSTPNVYNYNSIQSWYVNFGYKNVTTYDQRLNWGALLVRGGHGYSSFDLRKGTVPALHPHPELRHFSGWVRILAANGQQIWQGNVIEGDLGRMMGSYARGSYFVEGNMGTQRVVNP